MKRVAAAHGALAGAIVLAAVVSFAGIGSHSLWTPDEPTGSAVGRAMFESGDYVVPRLNGVPFLEKPPLYWWVQAAAFRVFGVSDASARVPSAVFGWLTLVATFGLARRVAGPRAGVVAVAVLATTAEFNEDMTRVIVDPALVCFVTIAYWAFAALAAPASRRDARLATVAIAVVIPLAFLAKGVVALGLGLAPPVAYLAWRGRANGRTLVRLLMPVAIIGTIASVAIVVPWAWFLVHRAGWSALRECLVGNTIGRAFTSAASAAYGHRQPFWYYGVNGVAATMPWILVLPAMLRAGAWRGGTESRRLLLASCAIGVLLLSAAESKRTLYLVPLLPAFAACVGWWAQHLVDSFDPDTSQHARLDRLTLDALAIVAALVPLLAFVAAIVIRTPAWWPATAYPFARLAGDLTPRRLTAIALAAGVGVAALAARFSGRTRTAGAPAIAGILGAYVLLFLAYQTAGKAFLDPVKNLHDLTAAVGRLTSPSAAVRAYRPTESLQAIVNFDLQRTVDPVGDPQAILNLFARDPHARLVIQSDVARDLPAAIAEHLRYFYNESGRKALPYAIVGWTF